MKYDPTGLEKQIMFACIGIIGINTEEGYQTILVRNKQIVHLSDLVLWDSLVQKNWAVELEAEGLFHKVFCLTEEGLEIIEDLLEVKIDKRMIA